MRSIIISIILFSLLLAGILLNSFVVHRISNTLISFAKELDDPCDKDMDSLVTYWNKNRIWLGLSIPATYLDTIEKTLISMNSAYSSGNIPEYRKNLDLFKQAVYSIYKSERISLENIL